MSGSPEERKIRHLRMAAHHLKTAGYEDGAKKARDEAARLHKAMMAKRQAWGAGGSREMHAKVTRLEHQVRKLQKQLNEMREYYEGKKSEEK